jgi:hypothetical protein
MVLLYRNESGNRIQIQVEVCVVETLEMYKPRHGKQAERLAALPTLTTPQPDQRRSTQPALPKGRRDYGRAKVIRHLYIVHVRKLQLDLAAETAIHRWRHAPALRCCELLA